MKYIMLADNHSSHTSGIGLAKLRRHFQVLFQPSHSSDFNSIEVFWGIVKQHFRKLVLLNDRELDRERLRELILSSLSMVTHEQLERIYRFNLRYIHRLLKE